MAVPTLAQLLQTYTVEQLLDIFISVYQAFGFPTTSWQPFGSERARNTAFATGLNKVSTQYMRQIAASGFLQLALTDAPDWVPLIAQQVYNLYQNPAQPAIGTMQFTNSSSSNYTFSAGQFITQFPLTGNRYTNVNAVTVPANTTSGNPVSAIFQSQGIGSQFNDPSAQALIPVSSFPGVGITNLANPSAGFHTGPSQGTISLGGSLNTFASIQVSIAVSGSIGLGPSATFYFNYSLNGSAASANILGTAAYAIPGTSITLNFADADPSNPSNFYQGDSWQFSIPGNWLIQIGTDEESIQQLAIRCVNQWGQISRVPNEGFYENLALATPNVGNQITQVLVTPDGYVGGKVNVCISGPDGYLSPNVIDLVRQNVLSYAPETDNPVVFTPSVLGIDFQGTITVAAPSSTSPIPPLQSIEQAITEALTVYIQSIQINGLIEIAQIIKIIMQQTGVINVCTVPTAGLTQVTIIAGMTTTTQDYQLGSIVNYVKAVAAPSQANNSIFNFSWIVAS